jgi:hypothetical protein
MLHGAPVGSCGLKHAASPSKLTHPTTNTIALGAA